MAPLSLRDVSPPAATVPPTGPPPSPVVARRSSIRLDPRDIQAVDSTPASNEAARDEAIRSGLVQQSMRDALRRQPVGIVLSIAMAVMWWPFAAREHLLLWLGVVLFCNFTHRQQAQHYLKSLVDAGAEAREQFLKTTTPLFVLMGIAWGAAPALFLGRGDEARQFASWVIIGAIVYGSAHRLSLLPVQQRAFTYTFYPSVFCAFLYSMVQPALGGHPALWFLPVCLFQFWLTRRMSRDVLATQTALHGAQYDLTRRTSEALATVAAKNKFLAAATHDMCQPVIAMGLYSELLEADLTSAEELAPKIGRAARSVNRLFSSLFDLAAFDAGQVRLQVDSVSVAAVVRDLQEEYEPLAEARGLVLHVRVRDASIRSDEMRLRRMIGNVLSNAIKYTEPGGRILLAVRPAGATVRVEVWDEGIGIPASQIDKVCQEFFRAEGGSRLAPDGLGIGLALVTRLANALRTRIDIDSIEGRGTRVCFTLGNVDDDPAKRVLLSADCG